ncbi:MAG: ester cyclase [Labilithrix sp.]|nr:ester cyclase [Labilithrix sp.]
MRKISFGLIGLGLVLVACGGEDMLPAPNAPTPPVVETPAPAPEAPKAEAPKPQPTLAELQQKNGRAMGEAMNAHDAKKLASFYAENAVVKMAGMPDVTGREAIAASWQKMFDAMGGFKTAVSRLWVKGDVVVVEWGFNATHSGDMMGVKATEKPVGAMGVEVMWFTPDGLVKESHVYHDSGTIMSQIGVSKQKARPIPSLAAQPQVFASTGSPDEAKNVDAASKMSAAFEKKNEADFVGASADDITWDDMTQPETMKGKAAGKKYFAEMTKAFPDAKATHSNVWGIGDYVIAEETFSGTHKGALFGIQPTKKSVNMHGLTIMQFKDGKVIKGWSYGNGAEMMSQLGQLPAAPAAKDAKPAAAPTKK